MEGNDKLKPTSFPGKLMTEINNRSNNLTAGNGIFANNFMESFIGTNQYIPAVYTTASSLNL